MKDKYNSIRDSSQKSTGDSPLKPLSSDAQKTIQGVAHSAVNYFPVMILALALMMIMFFLLSGRGEETALSLTLEKDGAGGISVGSGNGSDGGSASLNKRQQNSGSSSKGGGDPSKASGSADGRNDGSSSGEADSAPGKLLQVHIAGAVLYPGLYSLGASLRINDGVIAAGGLIASADADAVNLAEKLKDGTQVYIPFKNAGPRTPLAVIKPSGSPAQGSSSNASSLGSSASSASGSTSATGQGESGKQLINLNQANATELDTLPGVGPVMAEKIISYRATNGPFKNLEELKNVPGIGDKKFADMRSSLTL